jgi:hypothetical protein
MIILKHSLLSAYFSAVDRKNGKSHLRKDSMTDGKVMVLQFVKMKQPARGSLRPSTTPRRRNSSFNPPPTNNTLNHETTTNCFGGTRVE